MIHPTPAKVGQLILDSFPETVTLAKNLSLLLNKARELATTELANDNNLIGIIYSGTLFDDATDNLFYTVNIARVKDSDLWQSEVRVVHNSTQLYTGLMVLPSDVQPDPLNPVYESSTMNNITFPRILTHLLKDTIAKIATELGAATEIADLDNVAILKIAIQ